MRGIECYKFLQASPIYTSRKIMASFENEKQRFLDMSLEQKRSKYGTSKYVTLINIPTWPQYFVLNKQRIKTTALESDNISSSDLNDKVSIWKGDITYLEIDAIVNAANKRLLGGGGVDGAIHKSAGPLLKEECRTLGGCNIGEAKITGGYKLPAKYVIHTVGPYGENKKLLESCYKNSLKLASENGIRTIAFPCISTGVYGYPQEAAANVALSSVKSYLENESSDFDRVIFTLFLDEDVNIYTKLMQKYFPISEK